jgi:hypothetical protein
MTIEYSQFQMGLTIVLVAMLCVYFMRDVQLLATPHRRALWKGLIMYRAFQTMYLAFLSAELRPTSIFKPIRVFQTSPSWILGVFLRCLIWVLQLYRRRPFSHIDRDRLVGCHLVVGVVRSGAGRCRGDQICHSIRGYTNTAALILVPIAGIVQGF